MIDKRDYRNLVFKILSFSINLVISFFVSSFVIRTVGEEAYGFVGLANDFVSYAQIITIAINSMATRYITMEYERKNIESANRYYSSLFFANVIMTIAISAVGSIIILNLERLVNVSPEILLDVKILWFFILLNLGITLLGTAFTVAPFCKKRLDLVSFRDIIACIIRSIILVICYLCFKPFVLYIGIGTVISTLYTTVYNIKYSKRLMPELSIKRKDFKKANTIELIKSGGWNSITKTGTVLSSGLDLTVTNLSVGASSMGIMSVTKIIPNHIYTFVNTAASAFSPSFILAYARNDFKQMVADLKKTFRIFSVFSIVPIVLVISLAPNIFSLWVPSVNQNYLYSLTIAASIGYLAVMPFESIWSIYVASNKIKWSSIYLILESFANVGIELLLIQFTEDILIKMMIIVGVTSALQFLRVLFFFPFYTKKCIGESFGFMYLFLIKNFLVFFLLIVFGRFVVSFFPFYNWISLITSFLIIGVISIIICFFAILDSGDRLQLFNYLKSKTRKHRL